MYLSFTAGSRAAQPVLVAPLACRDWGPASQIARLLARHCLSYLVVVTGRSCGSHRPQPAALTLICASERLGLQCLYAALSCGSAEEHAIEITWGTVHTEGRLCTAKADGGHSRVCTYTLRPPQLVGAPGMEARSTALRPDSLGFVIHINGAPVSGESGDPCAELWGWGHDGVGGAKGGLGPYSLSRAPSHGSVSAVAASWGPAHPPGGPAVQFELSSCHRPVMDRAS